MNDYWQKQTTEPLFPDLLWSRPENKMQAGKLLIIGGNAHGFSAPATAYTEAEQAGIGTTRVLLPDHIRRQLLHFHGASLELEYAPSTPSGSFASKALAEMLDHALWADVVLLAGDLGRNSETAIAMESFTKKYTRKLVITKDAVDYFNTAPTAILNRENTVLVLTVAQLQRLVTEAHFTQAITFKMDMLHMVDWLHAFTQEFRSGIVVRHLDTIFVALNGRVSSTHSPQDLEDSWRVATAAHASTWWCQNDSKPFEALTMSVFTKPEE